MKIALLSLVLSVPLFAAPIADRAPLPVAVEEKFFNAKEFSLDLYGTASQCNADRNPHNVIFGAGGAANYFVTRGLGFGVRAESDNAGHSFFDRVSGRILLRAPLWDRIAPYGYLDGGFDFENDIWGAGAGGGLEYRFTRHLGIFGEAGLGVDTEGAGRMRGTAGLRIVF